MNMQPSDECLEFVKSFEGFRNEAYADTGGIWTIGYGTTHYPNGYKVHELDICTQQQALGWLLNDLRHAINTINQLIWNKPLNQSQFDALCSFEYNTGHLPDSTLYMKARQNPDDETIYKYNPENPERSCEFTKWITVKSKVIKGLLRRRMQEADLYGSAI
jgi:lysozyme